jgi:hypothetical protein
MDAFGSLLLMDQYCAIRPIEGLEISFRTHILPARFHQRIPGFKAPFRYNEICFEHIEI